MALAPFCVAWQIVGMDGAWTDWVRHISFPGLGGLLEILVLAVLFYYTILFFRGTRGAQVLLGFVTALVAMLVLAVLGALLR